MAAVWLAVAVATPSVAALPPAKRVGPPQGPVGWRDNPPKTEEEWAHYRQNLREWQDLLDQVYDFDLPAQSLADFTNAFRDKTGVVGCFEPWTGVTSEEIVGPLRGRYTVREALLAVGLGRAGVSWYWLWDKTIAYQGPLTDHIPQLSATPPTVSYAVKRLPRSAWGTGLPGDVEFVIVTGRRISIIENDTTAAMTLDRSKIDSLGASTLAELIEYLPQIPFIRSDDFRASGEQYADLRGLGPGTTLILINGRRVVASATSFDTGGFDINSIPLTAVRRIEILLDAPSVATGMDAIGGVINVVLKDDIATPLVEVRYGTAAGGAAERRLSMGAGLSRDRFHGAATVDAFRREALLGARRELTRDQDFRRHGGRDLRSIDASPGNITSTAAAPLPGLSTSFAAVPIGSSGIDLSPADFIETAGLRNRSSLTRFRSIIPDVTRLSVAASGEFKALPQLGVFGELLATRRINEFQIGPPTLSGWIVPASNAFNPFDAPVAVNVLLQSTPSRAVTTESDLVRAVTGVRAMWNRWEAELSAAWIRDQAELSRDNELDLSRVMMALGSPEEASALNVFRDGPPGSAQLLSSLLAPSQVQQFSSDAAQGHARAQGPLLALPAGALAALVGSEWRQERLSTPVLQDASRTVTAAFAELQLPLVRPSMAIGGVRELMVSLGARLDHYSAFGSELSPQYGLLWKPLESVKIRASYSSGYRAPTLFELDSSRVPIPVSLPDPRRHNEVTSFVVLAGGNPDLEPNKSHSWTAGFEVDPSDFPQLHVAAGYWRTVIDHRIAPIAIPTFINHETLFPDRIVRAPATPQDIAAGIPGALRTVDVSPGNFGSLDASGIDLNIAMTLESSLGRFTPSLTLSWIDSFRTTSVAGLPAQQRVGIASEFGTIPKWRAVASADWNRGPVTLFSALQFTSAYDDAVFGARTGRVIPARILWDAQASLRMDSLVAERSTLNGVKATVGITNLLDQQPHFAEAGLDLGYDSSQGSLKGRVWYLRLAKEF